MESSVKPSSEKGVCAPTLLGASDLHLGPQPPCDILRLTPSFRPGAAPVRTGAPEDQDVDSVIDELAGIVVLCDHAEQDAQFANIELGNALRNQQEIYAAMSKASKMLRGGAMPSIRNVR